MTSKTRSRASSGALPPWAAPTTGSAGAPVTCSAWFQTGQTVRALGPCSTLGSKPSICSCAAWNARASSSPRSSEDGGAANTAAWQKLPAQAGPVCQPARRVYTALGHAGARQARRDRSVIRDSTSARTVSVPPGCSRARLAGRGARGAGIVHQYSAQRLFASTTSRCRHHGTPPSSPIPSCVAPFASGAA